MVTVTRQGTLPHVDVIDDHGPAAASFVFLLLAPFFFVTYGFAARVAELHHNVGSIVFGWERAIPFLPWTIIPYWSTDLFYAASLFLCGTRQELATHVKRLVTIQVLSVVCFMVLPLRFSFDRPVASGIFGWLFAKLAAFDSPFNQAPSLHVGITVVLWPIFSAHLKGWSRRTVQAWFVLMALSTLTTYQHHFIDVATGLWAGMFCLALFPMRTVDDPQLRSGPAWKIAGVYAAGAAALVAGATTLQGAAWLLLWPAGSLAIVSVIYARRRGGLFQKNAGAISGPMAFLLAPYLAVAWINARVWTRHAPPREIHSGVWLGRSPARRERDALGIASLVDVSAELPVKTKGASYQCVPCLDLVVPSAAQLDAMVAAIEAERERRPTLVFCALGYSRGATAVGAWMLAQGHAKSVEDAVAAIRARRPQVALSSAHRRRLEEWRNQ